MINLLKACESARKTNSYICLLQNHSVVPTKFYSLSECPESGDGIEVKFRAKAAGLYVLSWKPESQRGLVQMEYGVTVDGILGEGDADSM